MSKDRPKVAGWLVQGCEDRPIIEDFDACVESFLDKYMKSVDWVKALRVPREITLIAETRMKITARDFQPYSPLTELLERLDEVYGDPEGAWEQTKKDMGFLRLAEKVFMDTVAAWYVPWACEDIPGSEIVVDTKAWIEKNHPVWLADGKLQFVSASQEGDRYDLD